MLFILGMSSLGSTTWCFWNGQPAFGVLCAAIAAVLLFLSVREDVNELNQ